MRAYFLWIQIEQTLNQIIYIFYESDVTVFECFILFIKLRFRFIECNHTRLVLYSEHNTEFILICTHTSISTLCTI